MAKEKSTTSHKFRERGIAVRVFKRGSSNVWTADFRVDGRRVMKSTEETGKDAAIGKAKEIVADELRDSLADVQPGADVTLGQLFRAYRRHHLGTLSEARQQEAEARVVMFTEAWGEDLPVSDVDPSRVKSYCAKRRSIEIVAPSFRLTPDGKRRRGYRKPKPIRDGGLDAEFRWLNSVFNFGVDHRVDGRPFLARNPLPKSAKKRRTMGWPKERNPRRPSATHQRYLATLKHADGADATGRLACIVALARWTGRRESAICELRAHDLLLSVERITAALADGGMDIGLAAHMPHGAIRWAAESDKQGLLFVSPISRDARAAVDAYMRSSPRMGDVPLFPSTKDATAPIRRDTAARLLLKAERAAGLPKLVGGVFHPYRRLWANERKHLPAADVAEAGGWADTQALTRIYQRADPRGVLEAVQARGTG